MNMCNQYNIYTHRDFFAMMGKGYTYKEQEVHRERGVSGGLI
jgi:hypothetical protein